MRRSRHADFGVAVLAATIVVLLSAAASLDPGAQGAHFAETASYLAVAVLVLCATRAVSSGEPMTATIGACLVRGGAASLLSLPAFTAAWQVGADRDQLLAALLAVIAAALCGVLLGRIGAVLGLRGTTGTLTCLAVGALLLWPASLGWFQSAPARFPRPEGSTMILVALLPGLAVLSKLTALVRGRPRSAG